MSLIINPKICPICGNENGCKAGTNEKCWCMNIIVPKELLNLIPLELQRKSCVCKKCIDEFVRDPNKFKDSR